MKDSFPPLFRGIGMVVMLIAAIVAFCIARQHGQSQRTRVSPNQIAAGKGSKDSPVSSVSGMNEPRAEAAQDTVVEDVLENVWFEWLGFAGTAIFATSFFAEAYLRCKKNN